MVSLLIVASVAMFFAINMLMDGLDNANLSIDNVRYETARINANTCLEDVLLRIKRQAIFDQPVSYTVSEGSQCSVTMNWLAESPVSDGLTEQRLSLQVVGVSEGFERQFDYELKVKKFDVNDSDGSLRYLKTIDFLSINEV